MRSAELPPISTGLSVSIREAVKRQVATGSAFLGGFMDPSGFSLTCDGAPHVYSVNVLPNPDSPAFRRGDAVVEGTAYTQTDCCSSDSGRAGPQVIRLR